MYTYSELSFLPHLLFFILTKNTFLFFVLISVATSISQKIIQESGVKTKDENFKKFSGIDYNFEFLNEIFDEFFEINGSRIYAKEKNLTNYINFITKVNPYQIIGYKLANFLSEEKLKLCDIFAMVKDINPLGYKREDRDDKKYAENHLHLKGANYSPFNLINLVNKKTKEEYYKKEYLNKIPRINEFSFINNSSISIGQIVDILKLSIDYIYGNVVDNTKESQNIYIDRLKKIESINRPTMFKFNYSLENIYKMSRVFNIFKNNALDTLLAEIVNSYHKKLFDKAHLLENILFFYLFINSKDSTLKTFIKLYFQGINILRSFMIMSQNLGLAHFSEFSASNIREVEKENARNTVSSIINSGTNYLNAKFNIREQKSKIYESVELFKGAFDKEAKNKNFNYNFCLSTAKGREKEIKREVHFLKKRQKLKREAKALDEFLRSVEYKRINKFKYKLRVDGIEAYIKKEELKNREFDISNYIVSIDAVGKETHTPPEVFAPFFRYLRREPKSLTNNIFRGVCNFKQHSKLLITAHGGEDFNYILTGLRQIDEIVNFFELSKGDRIGHALALGIKPKYWRESINEIVVSKGEYFDNLVWLVYKLNNIVKKLPKAQYLINRYSIEIFELFRELYPSITKTPQINDIFKAWQLRENCPIEFKRFRQKKMLFDEYTQIVFNENEFENEIAKEIYETYMFDETLRQKSKESLNLEVSNDELEIIEALQDFLITQYAKEGIVIEANPSSNIFISNIKDYSNHPIFRFYPPKDKFLRDGKKFNKYGFREGIIGVCVNSDDPAIFVTTLQNEFKFIKDSAIEHFNCSDREATLYVRSLRKYGVEIFKNSYN